MDMDSPEGAGALSGSGSRRGVSSVPSVGAGPGRRDGDSFYLQDCQQAQASTHAIQTLTGQISRLLNSMEAEQDYVSCRQLVDQALKQARETEMTLKRIQEHQRQAQHASERSNRRMMYHKLSDNLAITARVLEDVLRRFAAEEQKRFTHLAAPGADAAGGDDTPDAIADPEQPLVGGEVALEKMRRRADEDISSLQRIYSDLAVASEDHQDATYEALESHMAMASDMDLERGAENIANSRYNSERDCRKTAHMIGAGFLLVMGALAFIFSS